MAVDRVNKVEQNLLSFLDAAEKNSGPISSGRKWHGSQALLLELLESQFLSRILDYTSRHLKTLNQSYYTIGSAGHEGNVLLGRFLEKKDLCFLHYRSGAFMVERLRGQGRKTIVKDMLRSLTCSTLDPVSGGRHKVWGSFETNVPPQTSTIASHLPKAMGAAFGMGRAKQMKGAIHWPENAIVCASFGDASANHATALGAINTAAWIAYQSLPLPLLLVCEDNGIGISVRTPKHWIKDRFSQIPGIHYMAADGCDLGASHGPVQEAISVCRSKRKPVFLHLKTVRLLGHAGSDVPQMYMDESEIESDEAKDPLLVSCQIALETGATGPGDLREMYDDIKREVDALVQEVIHEPKLASAEAVMAPLAYTTTGLDARPPSPDPKQREQMFGGPTQLPENQSKPRHMAKLINWALRDVMLCYSQSILFGQDIARKGGVYNITEGLEAKMGLHRVFNTLLDEQSILGLAIGLSHLGYLPIPEIQYLAYFHNAEDQIRSEAASMQFFSDGKYRNPMVIRIASWAYQKGFGGHFHNDNAIGVLKDIPGIFVASPSRGDDAVLMLREAVSLAQSQGKIVFFLEPIALYMEKDLYVEGDAKWCFPYPSLETQAAPGALRPRVYHKDAKQLVIFTYANGAWMSLRAARNCLGSEAENRIKIVDLRWLKPLAVADILAEARGMQSILIVDEARKGGGLGEDLIAILTQNHIDAPIELIAAKDSYIPLGPAAAKVLPQVADIAQKIKAMISAGSA